MSTGVSVVSGGTSSTPSLPSLWNLISCPYPLQVVLHIPGTTPRDTNCLPGTKQPVFHPIFSYCHCSPFPHLASCEQKSYDPPTTAPFQKRSSFLRILSHSPICFSHTPVSSFDSKAWDYLWRFCYRDKQRTIKTQRDQLILVFGNQGRHQNERDFGVWPWYMISKLKKATTTRIQPEGKSSLLLSHLTLKDEHRDMWYLLSCLGF